MKIVAGGVMPKVRTSSIMLSLICAMYFIAFVDRVNISMASTAFGPEFGLSNTAIGMIISAFALPYLVFQVIGGWVGDKLAALDTDRQCANHGGGYHRDRHGRRIGLYGPRPGRIGHRGRGDLPGCDARSLSLDSRSERGWAQGVTHASARLGNAVCPPIIAFLMVLMSWRGSFFLVGAVTLVWAVAWAWYFRDDPHQHPAVTVEELAELQPAASTKSAATVPLARLALRMTPVAIVYFTYGWSLWLFLGWMPQYFYHNFRLNIAHSALFASSVFGAGVVGDILGGIVTDRLLRRTGDLKADAVNCRCRAPWCARRAGANALCTESCPVYDPTRSGLFCCEFTIGPMWSLPMDIAPSIAAPPPV